ncbi:MAG TPA: MmcQ/YjbR family DNA-binding protein [Marmoricola sp.]|nr:MmcQ/YjbR family DNA-binding protein [Marmoricola sp.]
MEPEQVRLVALGFAGTVERDHHGFPSFRGARRIFATIPDEQHVHVMLDEEDIRAAVAEWPAWCEEKWWGKRLSALRVSLADADTGIVAELLEDAWRQQA